MKRSLLALLLAVTLPVAAEEMKPNKEPVPSPSDLRTMSGEDRPQGQAREARTPSPSDLATERPRVDGDRPTSAIQDPRHAGVGMTQPAPSPSDLAAPVPPAR
ncbi:MAG TPA: hypothetical protein VM183_11760 [Burkholderiales bacterium]|nr:hypothetical protein [Burkholderiales bacterium]